MKTENKAFKLTWLGGKIEIIRGQTIADAFSKAGYGGGAIRALDTWEEVPLWVKGDDGVMRQNTA